MRDTARAPKPLTNPPTGHQMNRQGLYLPKKACFGQNLAVIGPKILMFTGGSKSFVTHITEKPPRHFVQICFLVGHGIKWAKNANIWPKMTENAYFGPNLAILGGGSKTFGTLISGNHHFCQQGIPPIHPGLQLFHWDHPKKTFHFRGMGHFLGFIPVFCHLGPFPPRYYKYPKLWTVVYETCWDRRGHQIYDPQWQWTWSLTELRRKGRFYVGPKSVFLAKNWFFFQRKHPKFAKSLIFGKRVLFYLYNFSRSRLEHV